MKIYDLTAEQCKMLDTMWNLDTQGALIAWFESLDKSKLEMAMTLHQLMVQELEEEDNDLNNPHEARNMLSDIGIKC